MVGRNSSLALLLVSGAMMSCQSFVNPRGPAFNLAGSLYESPDPEQSPESAVIPESDADSASAEGTSSFMGIDEDFIPFPHRDYTAPDVVQMCMETMTRNDEPYNNAGLEVCWNFSSDRCRAARGGSLEMFIEYAHNPIFASMVNALEWQVVSTGPLIQGTTTRGAMQTVLVNVQPQKGGEARRFLWTLQQERRPPRQGCWLVWECLAVENAYSHTL